MQRYELISNKQLITPVIQLQITVIQLRLPVESYYTLLYRAYHLIHFFLVLNQMRIEQMMNKSKE